VCARASYDIERAKESKRARYREEKAHERLWNGRKELQSQINQTYTKISSGIETIIEEKQPMEELIKEDTEQRGIEEPAKEQLPFLEVKRKKKKTTKTESA
jgi:CRISPR/Cas system CSM-associated protein Csm4 (group 5 of RAMP superfamily)